MSGKRKRLNTAKYVFKISRDVRKSKRNINLRMVLPLGGVISFATAKE